MTVEVMPLRASRERSSTGERQSGGAWSAHGGAGG